MRSTLTGGLVFCLLLAGCGHRRVSAPLLPSRPPRDAADAGIIATNTAIRAGIQLAEFVRPKVDWDASSGQWSFFYTLLPPGRPGGHFLIIVDQSGEAKLLGGK